MISSFGVSAYSVECVGTAGWSGYSGPARRNRSRFNRPMAGVSSGDEARASRRRQAQQKSGAAFATLTAVEATWYPLRQSPEDVVSSGPETEGTQSWPHLSYPGRLRAAACYSGRHPWASRLSFACLHRPAQPTRHPKHPPTKPAKRASRLGALVLSTRLWGERPSGSGVWISRASCGLLSCLVDLRT
jgi:hypothetical protein